MVAIVRKHLGRDRTAAWKERRFQLAVESLEIRAVPASIDFTPIADNTLYQDPSGQLSNGSGGNFYVGETNQASNSIRRGALKFDLSAIPAGTTITGATLTLNMSKSRGGNQTVELHRALKDWGEGQSFSTGRGSQADTGDATWLYSFYPTQMWTNQGGDFSATASASTFVGFTGNYQWSSAGMTADIQQWVDNPSSSFGWILTGNETTPLTAMQFDSKENFNSANWPKLTVTYGAAITPPTVSALSPTSGPAAGNTSVIITGTNFTNVNSVFFGTNPASFFTVDSATQITAMSPSGSGVVDVVVVTTDGSSQISAADHFTYIGNSGSIDLTPTADNTLYQDPTGQLSNGAGQHFYVGDTNQTTNNIRRGLLKFDVSSIPAGSVITGATLTLNMSATSAGAQPIQIHRALANWGEGASDFGSSGTGEGGGFQAMTNDATWLYSFYNSQSWANAGGDFSPTVSASTSVGGVGSYQWSSSGLIADVQEWLNNPAASFGWVLTGNETTRPTSKQFDSKENSNSSFWPKLTVSYAPAGTAFITAVTPPTGPLSGGATVSIAGVNFNNVNSVSFGASPALAYTVVSSSQITATSPSGLGMVDIVVNTSNGASPTSVADEYTYSNAPTVTAVDPFVGPLSGGNAVVITGYNFTGVTAVQFNTTNAISFTFNSATQITAIAPAGSSVVNVTVTTPNGISNTSATNDDYTYAVPVVTSVVVNGGAIVARNSFGATPVLAGKQSVVEQLLVTFNERVRLDANAFNISSLAASVTASVAIPSTEAVAVNSAPVTSTGNGTDGYTQYVLTFAAGNGVNSYTYNSNNFTTIKDGVWQLNVTGSRVHAGLSDTAATGAVSKFWALYSAVNSQDVTVSTSIGDGHSKLLSDGVALGEMYATFGSFQNIASPPAYTTPYDFNLDGIVDGIDLGKMYANFGTIWLF